MRTFIVLGHRAPLTPQFTLDDLPGSAGRLDVLCRCVGCAFLLSHGLRRDVQVFLVLQDQITIRLDGKRLRHLNPDERSTGALLKRALARLAEFEASRAAAASPVVVADAESLSADSPSTQTSPGLTAAEVESTPGVFVSRRGLVDVLDAVGGQGFQIVLLHEGGDPLREAALPKQPAFVLSDHLEFQARELAVLEDVPRLSVGPLSYHADHCITIVHNELDLRAAQGAGSRPLPSPLHDRRLNLPPARAKGLDTR